MDINVGQSSGHSLVDVSYDDDDFVEEDTDYSESMEDDGEDGAEDVSGENSIFNTNGVIYNDFYIKWPPAVIPAEYAVIQGQIVDTAKALQKRHAVKSVRRGDTYVEGESVLVVTLRGGLSRTTKQKRKKDKKKRVSGIDAFREEFKIGNNATIHLLHKDIEKQKVLDVFTDKKHMKDSIYHYIKRNKNDIYKYILVEEKLIRHIFGTSKPYGFKKMIDEINKQQVSGKDTSGHCSYKPYIKERKNKKSRITQLKLDAIHGKYATPCEAERMLEFIVKQNTCFLSYEQLIFDSDGGKIFNPITEPINHSGPIIKMEYEYFVRDILGYRFEEKIPDVPDDIEKTSDSCHKLLSVGHLKKSKFPIYIDSNNTDYPSSCVIVYRATADHRSYILYGRSPSKKLPLRKALNKSDIPDNSVYPIAAIFTGLYSIRQARNAFTFVGTAVTMKEDSKKVFVRPIDLSEREFFLQILRYCRTVDWKSQSNDNYTNCVMSNVRFYECGGKEFLQNGMEMPMRGVTKMDNVHKAIYNRLMTGNISRLYPYNITSDSILARQKQEMQISKERHNEYNRIRRGEERKRKLQELEEELRKKEEMKILRFQNVRDDSSGTESLPTEKEDTDDDTLSPPSSPLPPPKKKMKTMKAYSLKRHNAGKGTLCKNVMCKKKQH